MSNIVKVVFEYPDGSKREFEVNEGVTVLDVAHANGVPLEGACEGSLACSTCHVIVDGDSFTKLKSPAEEEEDMLDLAFGLEECSRLGCQIILTKELDGITLRVPKGSRNFGTIA